MASAATRWASSNRGFASAAGLVLLWLAAGPLMGYGELWQLSINTATTIVTFVMVFLIQRSQAKESKALQLKLDEIVAAISGASNRMISIEDLDEKELDAMNERFHALVRGAKRRHAERAALSIDQAAPAPRAAANEKG